MGREEQNLRQRDASTSPFTSGCGSSTSSDTEEKEKIGCPEVHTSWIPEAQDPSPSRRCPSPEPTFEEYQHEGVPYKKGDCVLVQVCVRSHLTIEAVKVVPGWIQRIYEQDVEVMTRYGFGRVSKLAVLAHCHSWTPEFLKQMTAAAARGRVLEQLPVMEEVFSGSLLEDRPGSPSYPGPSEPNSSCPSNSSHRYQGKSRIWCRITSQEPHRSRNLHQPGSLHQPRSRTQETSSSSSGPVQDDQVDYEQVPMVPQQSYERFYPPQENYLQGYHGQWFPQIPPTFSGQAYGYPPVAPAVQYVMVPQQFFNPGQSQTFYTRHCEPLDYRGFFPTDFGYASQ